MVNSDSIRENLRRRSFIVTSSNPLFLNDRNIVVYSADKGILVEYLSKNIKHYLKGHTDSVIALNFDIFDGNKIISAGLDGRIITWDLKNFNKLNVIDTKCELKFCFLFEDNIYFGYISKGDYYFKKCDKSFRVFETILKVDSGAIFATNVSSDKFVACVSDSYLIIYWLEYNISSRYYIPKGTLHSDRKHFTSIAVHPTDSIIATGNAIGEIFVWWNLCTQIDENLGMLYDLGDKYSSPIESDAEKSVEDQFCQVQNVVCDAQRSGRLMTYYPVHPSRVKRSLIHWHSLEVTSLCFTSCGKHLLSGGLEGVLVKWDLTECFGGPYERRFLPRLGAPIRAISSPGGLSEDAISICLENNTFHIVSGAFEQLYSQQGFLQIPPRWLTNSSIISPTILKVIDMNTQGHMHTLVSAGMGNLQMIRLDGNQSNVQRLEISRQSCIARDYTCTQPIVYTEIFLTAYLKTNAYVWIVTYERVQPLQINKSTWLMDDQSRITWWQCCSTDGSDYECGKAAEKRSLLFTMNKLVKFVPIDTYSMAHFNCSAIHMQFVVPTERDHLFVLLKDYRLVVWSRNPNFEDSCDYSPWILTSCHQLNYFVEMRSVWNLNLTPHCCTFPLHFEGHLKHYFALNSVQHLTLFDWCRIADLDLCNPLLAMDLVKELSLLKDKSLHLDRICCHDVSPVHVATASSYFLVQHIRGYTADSPKSASNHQSHIIGLLAVIEVAEIERCLTWKMQLVKSDCLPSCLTRHEQKPWIAVGLENAECVCIYELIATSKHKSSLSPVQLNCLFTFVNPPSLPLCDRHGKHRAGRQTKMKRSNQKPNTTRIVDLEFVATDQDYPQLVGLMETLFGRECGRRDFIHVGPSGSAVGVVTDHLKGVQLDDKPRSILQLAEMASVQSASFSSSKLNRKRHLAVDDELKETLRQITHYPIHSAPPPDQLFAQLMHKPQSRRQ